jgi:double-strand break repair protein MRE11
VIVYFNVYYFFRPEFNELLKFYITQPGSSVQTSLSESELAPKHVGILKIYKKSFKMEPIPLRSVRQFKMGHIMLSECNLNVTDKNIENKIEKLLASRVLKLVSECEKGFNKTNK